MSCAKPEAVSCRFGAPMGRPSYYEYDERYPTKCRLSHMPLDRGGYDAGGAYWGFPSNLYWLRSADNDSVQLFYRARSRKEAAQKALADYPSIQFVRRP